MVSALGVAYPDEILRTVADRMAHVRLGVLPVVDRNDPSKFVGLVTQFDLLEAGRNCWRKSEGPSGSWSFVARLTGRGTARSTLQTDSVQRAMVGFDCDDEGDWVAPARVRPPPTRPSPPAVAGASVGHDGGGSAEPAGITAGVPRL